MENLLPIGSVVALKGSDKRIMICGRVQLNVTNDETYDYSACLYPEGIINSKEMIVFNHDAIEKVYFIGFQDEEEFAFKQLLEEATKN